MIPLIVCVMTLSLVCVVLGALLNGVRDELLELRAEVYDARPPQVSHCPWGPPVPAPPKSPPPELVTTVVTNPDARDDLVRHAIDALVRVTEAALHPTPIVIGPDTDGRPAATGAPILEPIPDDERDPYEDWIPSMGVRQAGAIYDENDPNPFGIPGLVANMESN